MSRVHRRGSLSLNNVLNGPHNPPMRITLKDVMALPDVEYLQRITHYTYHVSPLYRTLNIETPSERMCRGPASCLQSNPTPRAYQHRTPPPRGDLLHQTRQ
jgi:hypothetical protein